MSLCGRYRNEEMKYLTIAEGRVPAGQPRPAHLLLPLAVAATPNPPSPTGPHVRSSLLGGHA